MPWDPMGHSTSSVGEGDVVCSVVESVGEGDVVMVESVGEGDVVMVESVGEGDVVGDGGECW